MAAIQKKERLVALILRRTGRDPLLLLWLAISDLWHEALLTACLILSIAAVSAPLLALYGLKEGVVDTMRGRLVHDPKIREITPSSTQKLAPAWFKEISARPEVGFVIPATRQIALGVEGTIKGSNRIEPFDLVPSREGDPLLIEHLPGGVPVLSSQDCILSAEAARKLGAHESEVLTLYVKRGRPGSDRSEISSVDLTVRAILNPAANARSVCFVLLGVAEAVENYRDGYAVEEYHWTGSAPKLQPEFDGLAVAGAISSDVEKQIMQQSGCTSVRKLSRTEGVAELPFAPPDSELRVFESSTGGITLEAIKRSASVFAGTGIPIRYSPYVHPIGGKLHTEGGDLNVQVFAGSADGFLDAGVPFDGTSTEFSVPIAAYASKSGGKSPQLLIETTDSQISLPLTLSTPKETFGTAPEKSLFLSWKIAGLLRASQGQPVETDLKRGIFLRKRRDYAGFRMYARTIDDVERLRDLLEKQGIETYTQVDKVSDVKTIDRNLGILLAVLGSLAVIGAGGVLVSTLFSAIERKRQPLSILRLLGIPVWKLCMIPVYQSSVAISLAGVIAFTAYKGSSWLIDRIFGAGLRAGESFCHIPGNHLLSIWFWALVLGWGISLLSFPLLRRMSISENLREE